MAAEPMEERGDVYYINDIDIADFRILCYMWNRESGKSDLLIDISNLATSGIKIEKERNKPDTLEVTIEYTQFKEKLQYEGSHPEYILMPFLTEVKIQRNFETIFAGTLFHLSLSLAEVGRQEVTLKCCSWGEHYEKRFVSECFHGTYPEIAQQLVMAGQHELNWFDNYAFEYVDEYWDGWEWSHFHHWRVTDAYATSPSGSSSIEPTGYRVGDVLSYAGGGGTCSFRVAKVSSSGRPEDLTLISSTVFTQDVSKYDEVRATGGSGSNCYLSLTTETGLIPPRSTDGRYGGGVLLLNGESAWTYSMANGNLTGDNPRQLDDLYFSFWYKCSHNSQLTLTMHAEGENYDTPGTVLKTFSCPVGGASDWTEYKTTIPAFGIADEIRWLKVAISGADMEFSDLQLYTKPKDHDAYDLDIKLGTIDAQGHKFDKYRVQHYHRQNIKSALYNVAKYVNFKNDKGEPDTFEYEFDENKVFNIYYKQGISIADPAFAATYPGNVKNLEIERGLEDIYNISYAEGDESKSYKGSDGYDEQYMKKWISAYSSPASTQRYGVMTEFQSYEGITSYGDLDDVAYSDLNIFDEIQSIPEIEVDSNIYNAGNVFLGDTITVNVLSDPLFEFINGTYRVYKYSLDISTDSVETMRLTLVPPDVQALQLISFPTQYKFLQNDVKRLVTGANY